MAQYRGFSRRMHAELKLFKLFRPGAGGSLRFWRDPFLPPGFPPRLHAPRASAPPRLRAPRASTPPRLHPASPRPPDLRPLRPLVLPPRTVVSCREGSLDECARGVEAMRFWISTICMLAVSGATAHAQTKESKALVDLEMMTWPELKQALQEGKTRSEEHTSELQS